MQGTKFIDYDTFFNDDERNQAEHLKNALKFNDAVCEPKFKKYNDVVKLSILVLESDYKNLKALHSTSAHSRDGPWGC